MNDDAEKEVSMKARFIQRKEGSVESEIYIGCIRKGEYI